MVFSAKVSRPSTPPSIGRQQSTTQAAVASACITIMETDSDPSGFSTVSTRSTTK